MHELRDLEHPASPHHRSPLKSSDLGNVYHCHALLQGMSSRRVLTYIERLILLGVVMFLNALPLTCPGDQAILRFSLLRGIEWLQPQPQEVIISPVQNCELELEPH